MSVLSTFLIIMLTSLELEWISMENLILLAAFTSLTLVIKLADWLRLFESTAFYVRLVIQTLSDITAFLILFGFAILLFTVPISVLNLNRTEDQSLVTVIFNNPMVDGLLNQYMLSLGEFALLTDQSTGYGNNVETVLIMAMFLGATFFTQITMLNMLVAIMGDTFDRSMDNRIRFGT